MALGTIQCNLKNSPYKHSLWREIEEVSAQIQSEYQLETIKSNKMITATRNMYLACGKKPGRYRPAAEALMRRIVKGMELYKINTLVDLVNLVSLKTGYSIGGFDAGFIEGDVEASIGRENEPYHAIGRGQFNIHMLPALRDEKGAIGTPTSDEIRTAIQPETTKFLMNINGYTGAEDLKKAIDYSVELLKKYVDATDIEVKIIE
jgi:DNA/RNA-binding domain of Phe-tRNA-synthetase-like protein